MHMKKEDIILEYIKEYMDEHDYAPSIREIKKGCGMSSTSVVNYHLQGLELKGIISRERFKARTIVVL
jgi:repressor LexA